MLLIIEHLEPVLSRWVWIEYSNVSKIIGRNNLIITNVKQEKERKFLEKIAKKVYSESITELSLASKYIVLDPQASNLLSLDDLRQGYPVIIGGIMGDYPPRGRTKKLLTNRLKNSIPRSLGKLQFSVDGVAYIVKTMYSEGKQLTDIPVTEGLEIEVEKRNGIVHTIYLPYGYPLVNGKPFISEELVEYLKHGIEEDEIRMIREGRPISVVDDE